MASQNIILACFCCWYSTLWKLTYGSINRNKCVRAIHSFVHVYVDLNYSNRSFGSSYCQPSSSPSDFHLPPSTPPLLYQHSAVVVVAALFFFLVLFCPLFHVWIIFVCLPFWLLYSIMPFFSYFHCLHSLLVGCCIPLKVI